MRKVIALNDNWNLIKDNKATVVSLPHSFNEADGQGDGRMYRGVASYVRKINILDSDLKKEIYLEIGAASNLSEVFINNVNVGSSTCGFSMLRYRIDSYLSIGENEIKIIVSNKQCQELYPAIADFSFYGGLYRYVNLIFDEKLHFDELDNSRDGFDATAFVEGKNGRILLNARIKNALKENAKLKILLKDKNNNEVYQNQIEASESLSYEFLVSNVSLWQGITDPYLYKLTLSLYCDDYLYDERAIKIGFRKLEYDNNLGFLLNGIPYKINGVGRHQDYAHKGNAITISDVKKDLNLILNMGANSIRATHYQHMDEFYSLCDELGILVWAEIPVISAITQNKVSDDNAFMQLRYLISQVRNHTCVFCYGVQNEVCMVTKCEYSFNLVKKLAAFAKELDSSRFTAQANEYTTEDDCTINSYTDIIGYNLYYGWYYGEMSDLGPRLDKIREANPQKPIILTEYGVDTNPKIHSINPKKNDYSEEYQVLYAKNALKTIKERPWLAGSYAWVMFDFGSTSRDEGGKKGQNQKGLITIDRETIKDAYYVYKANWCKDKFIYVAGKRYYNRCEEKTTINVITNLDDVILKGSNYQMKVHSNYGIASFNDVPLNKGLNRFEAFAKKGDFTYNTYIIINRVNELDISYVIEKKSERQTAINWFENVDVEELVSLDKPLRPEGFSLDDKICDIFSKDDAKNIFMKHFAFLTESSRFDENSPITLKKILDFAHVEIQENIKKKINAEFNMIDK